MTTPFLTVSVFVSVRRITSCTFGFSKVSISLGFRLIFDWGLLVEHSGRLHLLGALLSARIWNAR